MKTNNMDHKAVFFKRDYKIIKIYTAEPKLNLSLIFIYIFIGQRYLPHICLSISMLICTWVSCFFLLYINEK